jgi:hypothetical protein
MGNGQAAGGKPSEELSSGNEFGVNFLYGSLLTIVVPMWKCCAK